MTDLNLLIRVIDDSGKTITHLAKRLGLTREGLYKKLNGETEFKVSEANLLSTELNIDDNLKTKIFFGKISELNSLNS